MTIYNLLTDDDFKEIENLHSQGLEIPLKLLDRVVDRNILSLSLEKYLLMRIFQLLRDN